MSARNIRKAIEYRRTRYGLVISGSAFVVLGYIYSNTVATIFGLGLIFWGALLTYITSETYFRGDFTESALLSPLQAIDQMLSVMNLNEKGIYLPPRYLRALREDLVFIPKNQGQGIPDAEEIAQGKKVFSNPEGIVITPPGSSLVSTYEKELGIDFLRLEVNDALKKISDFLIDRANLAEKFEWISEENTVSVVIEGSKMANLTSNLLNTLQLTRIMGGPVESSIAVAIARSTGRPIIIRENSISEDHLTQKLTFDLLPAS